MRIISKYKDFYDGAQSFGVDLSIVYTRFQKVVEPKGLHQFAKFHENYVSDVPRLGSIYLKGIYDKSKDTIFIDFCTIGFCGKLYPFVSLYKEHEDSVLWKKNYYSFEKLFAYLEKLKSNYPNLTLGSYYYRSSNINKQEFKKFFESSVFQKDYTQWFQELKAPSFVFTKDPNDEGVQFRSEYRAYDYLSFKYIVSNPILKKHEFYKIKDPYSCFQEIA
ncbi:MAG: hypothetical protein AAGK97_09930 [Bacteroidota bacterium]